MLNIRQDIRATPKATVIELQESMVQQSEAQATDDMEVSVRQSRESGRSMHLVQRRMPAVC